MDLALNFYSSNGFSFDLAMNGHDLTTEAGLRSAVMVSLFTDARANEDDDIPDGTGHRRGCWQDSYLEDANDSLGSRLWLLSREKELPAVRARAKEYAEEALQWLIDDGYALSVDVSAEHVRSSVLGLLIRMRLKDGGVFDEVFDYVLEG